MATEMNLLEADRLAEVSQELRRYRVVPRVRTVFDTRPPKYYLYYMGENEGSVVMRGVKTIMYWIDLEDYSFATEAEAWAQLPEGLKAYRETLR